MPKQKPTNTKKDTTKAPSPLENLQKPTPISTIITRSDNNQKSERRGRDN